MLPAAPQPAWSDLAAALVGTAADDETLAAPWKRGDQRAIWFSRSSWALVAIIDTWRRANDGHPPQVWLPDYFCNQSTTGIRESGITPVFYPITAGLTPDWSACAAMAIDAKPDIFIAVHYYGVDFDMAPAAEFCGRHAAWLVEDAAHMLVPRGNAGHTGDFVIYSPYKFLPVPDAGLMLCRDMDVDISSFPGRTPNPVSWFLKRALQRGAPTIASALARRPLDFGVDPSTLALPSTPALSGVARRILTRAIRDLAGLAAARRRAADRWAAYLPNIDPTLRPFETTEATPDHVPYRFVVDGGDEATARRAYSMFTDAGWPVGTWPDLAPEVRAAPDWHAVTLELRRRLLLLPVHLDLDAALIGAQSFPNR